MILKVWIDPPAHSPSGPSTFQQVADVGNHDSRNRRSRGHQSGKFVLSLSEQRGDHHRFFFRDFSGLIRQDSVLKKMWRDYNENLRGTLEKAAQLWMEKGYLKKFADKKELAGFIDNSWILAHFSLGYLEATTAGGPKKAQELSLELFVRYLYPYHTERGQRALRLYLLES